MNCPACSHALTPLSVGELTVDACEGGCGGIWFDHYELRKVDEPSEALGDQLLDVQRDPSVVVDPSKRYDCPKCNDGVVMMRHFWSVRREITIDECPECGGIFLDAGELAQDPVGVPERGGEGGRRGLVLPLDRRLGVRRRTRGRPPRPARRRARTARDLARIVTVDVPVPCDRRRPAAVVARQQCEKRLIIRWNPCWSP